MKGKKFIEENAKMNLLKGVNSRIRENGKYVQDQTGIRKLDHDPVTVADGKSGLNWIERSILKIIIRKGIKKLENMKGSWKTSLAGWLVLIIALATGFLNVIDGDPTTVVDLKAIIDAFSLLGIAIPTWIGLVLARGKEVTSSAQAEAGTKMKEA